MRHDGQETPMNISREFSLSIVDIGMSHVLRQSILGRRRRLFSYISSCLLPSLASYRIHTRLLKNALMW